MKPSPTPERSPAADQSPRLLTKPQVLAIAGVSFPTLWKMMRKGEFPPARVLGGKSMWLSTEIDEWIGALPLRKYAEAEADQETTAA